MTPAPRLAPLHDWQPVSSDPAARHSLTTPLPAGELTLTAQRVDTIGAALWHVEVVTPASPTPLPERAAKVAGRVRGLLEDLRVYEVDATRAEAVLRSEAPAARGDDRYYYEVRLRDTERGSGATVERYRADTAKVGHREAVPFTLTHDAVEQLALDLAGSGKPA